MRLINIKDPTEQVNFRQAVLRGLGRAQGLFFPQRFDELDDVGALLKQPFVPRSAAVLHHLIAGEIEKATLERMVASAFDFPVEVTDLGASGGRVHALELFHGPTIAFKDVAMQLLARMMDHALAERGERATIIGATIRLRLRKKNSSSRYGRTPVMMFTKAMETEGADRKLTDAALEKAQ